MWHSLELAPLGPRLWLLTRKKIKFSILVGCNFFVSSRGKKNYMRYSCGQRLYASCACQHRQTFTCLMTLRNTTFSQKVCSTHTIQQERGGWSGQADCWPWRKDIGGAGNSCNGWAAEKEGQGGSIFFYSLQTLRPKII